MTQDQTPALLKALSAELTAMRAVVEDLSPLVAELALKTPIESRPRILIQAQAVDGVAQRLDAVSVLAADLADGQPLNAALDAIPLAELADRLRQALTDAPTPAAPSAPAGDLVLFD